MRRGIKLKKKGLYLKQANIITLIVLSIIVFSLVIYFKFNAVITPRILEIANMRFNNMTNLIVHKSFDKDNLRPELLDDVIKINYVNNEISTVDFNMASIYELADIVSESFNKNFSYAESGQLEKLGYYDSDAINVTNGYVLKLPIGVASRNVFLANLGPKIPVKIKFIGTVLTEVRTKVSDYGINNALIEVYFDISIEREIITPVAFEVVKLPYTLLVSSKIVYGKVPNFYAGVMTKGSQVNIPIAD